MLFLQLRDSSLEFGQFRPQDIGSGVLRATRRPISSERWFIRHQPLGDVISMIQDQVEVERAFFRVQFASGRLPG